MAHDDDTKWHWQEGNKYAVEGIKTLLLLNGAPALGLLTFAGGHPGVSVGFPLLCFGLGALFAGLVFIFAYTTQLYYGNKNWPRANIFHTVTYILILASVIGFVGGLFSAWWNLPLSASGA